MLASELATPFTIVWKTLAEEEAVFEVIAEVVATTPLTVEVIVLPEVVAVLVTARPAIEVVAITPLMLVVRIPVEVAKEVVALVIMEEVATELLPTVEVRVLPDTLRVLLVFRLVTARFVPVALVKSRLVMVEVMELRMFEKKLLEVALVVTRLVVVALLKIGLDVKVYVTCPFVLVATVRLLLVDEARKE